MADQKIPRPVLNLDTLIANRSVIIDGKEYDLFDPEMLSPIDGHRLKICGRRLMALLDQDGLSPDEEAELERIPDKVCRAVLDAPAEIHERLTTRQRMAIVEAFISRTRPMMPPTEPAPMPAAPSTGEN